MDKENKKYSAYKGNIDGERLNESFWDDFGVTGWMKKGYETAGLVFGDSARKQFAILLVYFRDITKNTRALVLLDKVAEGVNKAIRNKKNKVSTNDEGERPESLGSALTWGAVDGAFTAGAVKGAKKSAQKVGTKIGSKVASKGVGKAFGWVPVVGWIMLGMDILNDAYNIIQAGINKANPMAAPIHAIHTLKKYFNLIGRRGMSSEVVSALNELHNIIKTDKNYYAKNKKLPVYTQSKNTANQQTAANNLTANVGNSAGTAAKAAQISKQFPTDRRSAFAYVSKYQNYPVQGAGWLRNMQRLGVDNNQIQQLRNLINNTQMNNNYKMVAENRNRKNTIQLTEAQLHDIVSEATMEVLNESWKSGLLKQLVKGGKGIIKGAFNGGKNAFAKAFGKGATKNATRQAAKKEATAAAKKALAKRNGQALTQKGIQTAMTKNKTWVEGLAKNLPQEARLTPAEVKKLGPAGVDVFYKTMLKESEALVAKGVTGQTAANFLKGGLRRKVLSYALAAAGGAAAFGYGMHKHHQNKVNGQDQGQSNSFDYVNSGSANPYYWDNQQVGEYGGMNGGTYENPYGGGYGGGYDGGYGGGYGNGNTSGSGMPNGFEWNVPQTPGGRYNGYYNVYGTPLQRDSGHPIDLRGVPKLM